MAPLKINTYNFRGLNSPKKRHQISRELKEFAANIVFPQETNVAFTPEGAADN